MRKRRVKPREHILGLCDDLFETKRFNVTFDSGPNSSCLMKFIRA